MLERTHLAIIREVDRHGSLTAAANVLCLTQSALSHTVKKMEMQLGGPLRRLPTTASTCESVISAVTFNFTP